jgi:hypothetical protein
VVATWIGGTAVNAQYPPSPSQVLLAAGNPSPGPGETVSIAASARDGSGAALAGVDCSFEITVQPGSGAAVSPTTATTNSDGVATTNLQTGTAAGTIVIEATCGDESDTVSVTVSASGAAEPPASLPGAGNGLDRTGGGTTTTLVMLAFAVAALVAITGAGVLGRSKR